MHKVMTLCLGALLAAGCTTPQQRAATAQAEMGRAMAAYGPACAQLGYRDDSDRWRDCVLQLSARDDLRRYAYPPCHGAPGRPHWPLDGYWGPYW
jgi:hypothetical protein